MTTPALAGCILAGGLARRMGGGDKPLLSLGGETMLARVIARLRPQVGPLVLNANGEAGRFAGFGLPVAPDPVDGFAGPLAGVLAGLRWAQVHAPQAEGIVSVAGDTPFYPADLAVRLMAARGEDPHRIVLARADGHMHPVFGYWPVSAADSLETFLREGTTRKVLAFVDMHPNASADFTPPPGAPDPFFNVNTPEDLAAAEELLKAEA
ncbi:molybdenum cofactor guanylyltransferase MobA [Stappia sp. 28M-7]|uniref:molybdenum cofactor guanylyltransferase MobA n=1 Tax=Stappia sp. 28M-7 TaxID=2762596 RepID=UPI00163C1769|nr:molybdenum cofactor guanylyltransferase MobA [Stappia sp. 28M-7]MBC2859259.1 molybdenum cofactor guanylyltransferase MobA [Stappia sp. 28M-7]